MNKNRLSGFFPVFKFTFESNVKNFKYIALTVGFALLLTLGLGAILVFTSAPDDEEETEFTIEQVTVYDATGLGIPEYAVFAQSMENESVAGVKFNICEDDKKFLEDNAENADYVLVVQEENEDGFLLNIVTSTDSTVDEYNLHLLGSAMSEYFQIFVYGNSGLSEEALAQALLGVSYTVSDFNETDSGKEVVTIVASMLFMFVVYMMILMYGQQICASVSMEKTTKLVEQLLVSVTPYGLVAGKILAIIAASILQFIIWILGVFVGIFGGDKVASMVYENYDSSLSMYMDLLKGWYGEMSFSVGTIILAVLLMLLGLVFYLIIAGLAGSMVTKPENAANVQVIFVFPLVISFFAVFFSMLSGNGFIPVPYHFIPFTSAMVTPAAVLMGDLPIWSALISLLIMVLGSILLLVLAARIYKALLFYTGKKLNFKEIFKKES